MLCLVAQSYPTLCNLTDCSPPGSSVHGDSPGKNTGMGCQALLQGIFPTQGLNPTLPHCRQILYSLSHQGSPRMLERVTYSFSRWSSQRSRQILYQLNYQGSPADTFINMYIKHTRFFNLFFNWRIIALQNVVAFCQTSTWISYRYTYSPSLLNLPPIFHPIPPL